MTQIKSFVSLHNHSDYSLFDAISKYENMVLKANELGQNALGICEHGTTSGLLDFYIKANKAGIKPILGCEFYFSTNINNKDRDNIYHLCLYAKDFEGYKNLHILNSYAHQHIYYKPRLSLEFLRKHSNGLICTSACMGGVLQRDDAKVWATTFKEIFGEDYFIEMQFNNLPAQYDYNCKVLEISRLLNIRCTVGVDSHYINKSDAYVHRCWKFIKDNSTHFTTDDYYMMSQDEVIERGVLDFSAEIVEECIESTFDIANQCNCIIPDEKLNYPIFPIANHKERILEICREGAKKKLVIPVSHTYAERIKHEIDIMGKANYYNYFLILHELLTWCDSVGIYRGAGRGSVVSSLIAYLMNITGLDPLKYDLIYERFLHLERVTPCDIDTDFMSTRRDEVIQHLKDKYIAYQVRTFNLVGAKAGIQRAGQSLGLNPLEIDRISASIPQNKTLDFLPKKYDGKIFTQKQYNDLLFLAYAFQGIIQSFGIHASAVMVFPKAVENWCSIEKQESKIKNQDSKFVVNYDFHLLEDKCGLLKLDILGVKTMDVIQGTISQLKNVDFDINNLPDTDELTMKMLCEGKTGGCFQIESDGMTDLVKKLKPASFKDIIPLVALYRPGCIKAGMVDQFVNRKCGKEEINYILPSLELVMKNTYGVMLYQEQVMKMVQVMANYSLGQADMFRRAIGRKDVELMNKILPPFILACEKNGYSHEQAQLVADYINGCSDYLFNQGHSAGYGYCAYQTAFLKAHYPKEYFCSLLNTHLDDKDKQIFYIQDARKLGVKVFPPSIRDSKTLWSVTNDGVLRVGFGAIRNVGMFDLPTDECDFHGFMKKYHSLDKKIIEYLIKAGCFDGDRGLQLAQLKWYKDNKNGYKRFIECHQKIEQAIKNKNKNKQNEWLSKLKSITSIDDITPIKGCVADWEREALGFTFSDKLDDYDLSLCDSFPDIIAGEIISIKPWVTKNGDPMAFIGVRSKDKIHKLVMFSDEFNSLKLFDVYFFKTKGTIINDFTNVQIKK